jgi:hypothetical protein
MFRYFIFTYLLLALIITSGCGKKLKNLPVSYVEGLVTLDSEPLSDANVVFMPAKQDTGETARGKTDSNGIYKLTSINGDPDKGALPAEYVVMIWKSETRVVDPPRYDKEADAYISHEAVDVVPAVYAEPKSTPFAFTVEKVEKNQFDLPLSSTAKAKR